MGYDLDAVLAKRGDISKWSLTSALVYPLTVELGLIPITGLFWEEVKPFEDWAEGVSKGTKVAHLEASFFGGAGGHSCTLWIDGKSTVGLDINEVLPHFGVEPMEHSDPFDSVGLGRYRSNEKWAAHAVVDPIQDSVEELIDMLQYESEDKQVQETVRSVAAYRLGELKAVKALDALRQALDDAEYGTRLSASSALGAIGEPALPIMIGALNAEDPWGVVFALGKMGAAAKPAASSLVPLLRHADWRIRIQVIHTLQEIGLVGAEVEALLTDPNRLVRDAARAALGSKRQGV